MLLRFVIIKLITLTTYIVKWAYPRLFPSHDAYILMPVALGTHATFMANGSFRKDSHGRYELATRICLTFMIKTVPDKK